MKTEQALKRRQRHRRPGADAIYSDVDDGRESDDDVEVASAGKAVAAPPAPAPVPAPAPAPVAAAPAPPPADLSDLSGLGIDLGPLGVAMQSMRAALTQAAEAQGKEAAGRQRDKEAWEAMRADLEARLAAAEQRADEEHAHVDALTLQLASTREAARRADAERDKEREAKVAAEAALKEGLARAEGDVEAARNQAAAAIGAVRKQADVDIEDAKTVAAGVLKEREAGWAREREALQKEIAELKAMINQARAAHEEEVARLTGEAQAKEQKLAAAGDGHKKVEGELKDARSRIESLESAHAKAVEESKARHATEVAALMAQAAQASLDADRALQAAKEAGDKRASELQSAIDDRDKLIEQLKVQIATLEASLSDAKQHLEKTIAESQESIALIRTDCDAKVAVVRDEAAAEVEAAHRAVESTTINAVRSVAEAQHELQDVQKASAAEIERMRVTFESDKAAILAAAEEAKAKLTSEVKAAAEAHISAVESECETRLADKDDELQRVRDNLETVSKAFRSECEKVVNLESELRQMKSDAAGVKRRNLFGGGSAAAASSPEPAQPPVVPPPTASGTISPDGKVIILSTGQVIAAEAPPSAKKAASSSSIFSGWGSKRQVAATASTTVTVADQPSSGSAAVTAALSAALEDAAAATLSSASAPPASAGTITQAVTVADASSPASGSLSPTK